MTVSLRTTLLVTAAAALVAGLGAWCAKPVPAAGPAKVQVDTLFMEKERVPVKPSLGQKLTTATVKPTQTRVADAPSAQGKAAVAGYCDPVIVLPDHGKVAVDSQPRASDEVEDLPHSARLPDFQGRKDGPRLTLLSTLNDGLRWSADYHARGRISWRSDGDSVLVRGDRLWVRLLRGSARCAPPIGASVLLGGLADTEKPLRGVVITAAAAALGCIF